jgi:taurine dioxygenase
MDRLCRQADYPEYQCRFRWEQGSVAFWDNRAVQHYANSDYWPDVRVMERASIVGARPAA